MSGSQPKLWTRRSAIVSAMLAAGYTLVGKKAFANFTPPPNDTIYGQQWHLTLIDCPTAWLLSQGDSSTIIAVIGSGVTLSTDNPPNQIAGYNYVNNNTNTADQVGGQGHDSLVTAILMGHTNDASGSAGVCPNATLLPIVACNSAGSCASSLVSDSCDFAIANGAHIVNMSLANTTPSARPGVMRAVNAGLLLVAGSGDTGNSRPTWEPAAMDGVLGVASTTDTDVLWSGTTFGNNKICAPGGSGSGADLLYTTGKTGATGGVAATSFAVPVATGVAGLMRTANSRYAALRGDEMYMLICKYGCVAVNGIAGYPTLDPLYGYGRISAAKSVQAAYDYVRPFAVKALPIGQ